LEKRQRKNNNDRVYAVIYIFIVLRCFLYAIIYLIRQKQKKDDCFWSLEPETFWSMREETSSSLLLFFLHLYLYLYLTILLYFFFFYFFFFFCLFF